MEAGYGRGDTLALWGASLEIVYTLPDNRLYGKVVCYSTRYINLWDRHPTIYLVFGVVYIVKDISDSTVLGSSSITMVNDPPPLRQR